MLTYQSLVVIAPGPLAIRKESMSAGFLGPGIVLEKIIFLKPFFKRNIVIENDKAPKPSAEKPNAISLGSEKNHMGGSSSPIVTGVSRSEQ